MVSKICAALAWARSKLKPADLVRDLDHPAGIDHVVGRVDDAAVGEQLLDAGVSQLVVGAAADDLGVQQRRCCRR